MLLVYTSLFPSVYCKNAKDALSLLLTQQSLNHTFVLHYPIMTTTNTEDTAYDPGDLVIPRFTVPPHPSEAKQERSPWRRRIICIAIILGIVVVGTIGFMLALTGGQGPQAIFIQEDPPGLKETNRWATNGRRGLDLFVMNSCEDRWTPIFDEYITAWDNGTPDALTLTTRKFPHDPDCSAHSGRANVCNFNYGNTDWRGLNTAFLRNGFVQHSVAKLNDFHLDRESEDQKRYTMCHELGKVICVLGVVCAYSKVFI